jgi:hypothetical protein
MNKKVKKLLAIWVAGLVALIVSLAGLVSGAQAKKECQTIFIPPDTFRTVCSDSSDPDSWPGKCIPGTYRHETIFVPIGDGACALIVREVDVCTGAVLWEDVRTIYADCYGSPSGSNPCIRFKITPGGISCGTEWLVEAGVSFPATYLDLRPYPATLVRWPTAVRCGGLPAASGSGTYDYVPYGGGSQDHPKVGDWRGLKLTLTLRPAGPMFFSMPQVGTLALPDVGAAGSPSIVQWELPSHPEAGGSVLAGSVSGLGELPPDMPLFAGAASSPYRLFWRLTYERYKRDCAPGPDPDAGDYDCKTHKGLPEDDGHWEYAWEGRSDGGEITPRLVQGLPPSLAADLNGDGVPDAYWNRIVTIRRMDEGGRVDNPQWAASWNWGGAVYWAVREGQGQIGWP